MHRPHVGIYGRTNAGKSSLLNFLTGQNVAIVSPEAGTTTDTVRRVFEISGYGPVVFIDTAGLDDSSELGSKRTAASLSTLMEIELALVVVRGEVSSVEREFIDILRVNDIPYLLVYNGIPGSADMALANNSAVSDPADFEYLHTSLTGTADYLLEAVKSALPCAGDMSDKAASFFGGKVGGGDIVIMVCPIDQGAPEGRLILPQVQALRAALDQHAISIVVQLSQLGQVLSSVNPAMVVTDSQVFEEVGKIVPANVPLTSFSILLAAIKGDPEVYGEGLKALDSLQEGDRVLILENCSHQTSCDDIGRVKIPRWIGEYTGSRQNFTIVSGRDPLPVDLAKYSLAVQCGGCMVPRRLIQSRIKAAVKAGVPVTNYGMLIRKLRG